ncbi:PH domain-containing protein [Psychroflexus aestuariivivens]|uniref:PH domain-containing protein n=1 Tax=Psychroflexus aestuariivivens TaxID=1795040 RepID=UPI000FD75599|nr:PH domain-containing protein [Psychroflexus aestuariivivens]
MSDFDFSVPRRQSFNGVFLIFLADLVKRIRQNIYLLAVPFFKQNLMQDYGLYIYLGLALLLVIQFVYSYLSYLKFQFSIQEDAFHLDHGVIKLSHVEIPFERIQNINLQQNILQQVFNVVGFEIETAGEGTAEIKIKALENNFAKALKNKLIEEKKRAKNEDVNESQDSETKATTSDEVSEHAESEEKSLLFQLSFSRLLKVGVSSNFLKGLGLLFAFFAYVYNFIMDFLSNIYDIDFDEDFKNRIPETLSFVVIMIFGLFILGFLITILMTILKYFNLKIVKNQQNYEVDYGLFKRVNKVIKKSKTQIFEIETNPLKKFFKINNIYVSQAASNQVTEKQKIGLVGVSTDNINTLFNSIYDLKLPEQKFDRLQSQPRLIFRYLYRNLILLAVLGGLAYIFYFNWLSVSTIVFIAIVLAYVIQLKVKKSYIGFNQDLICVGGGSIHTNTKFIEIHKLQSVHLKRNIFQQNNNHADLVLETASGTVTIEYLKVKSANDIFNYLIYKIESTDKDWI